MILDLQPKPGRVCGPGWAGFTYHLDSHLVSPGIAQVTAPDARAAGRLVPSHVFTVIDKDQVAEALGQGFTIGPLAKYLDPEDSRVIVWFARPRGLTPKAAEFMCLTARLWEETGYDWKGAGGLGLEDPERMAAGLRNRLEDPECLFCSESYVRLLQLAAELFNPALPPAIIQHAASSWSPWALWSCPNLWSQAA